MKQIVYYIRKPLNRSNTHTTKMYKCFYSNKSTYSNIHNKKEAYISVSLFIDD